MVILLDHAQLEVGYPGGESDSGQRSKGELVLKVCPELLGEAIK